MNHDLSAGKVSRPAALPQRSAAASRNEMHTDIAAVPDYATVVRQRDEARAELARLRGLIGGNPRGDARLLGDLTSCEDVADPRSAPLVSLKQGDYRQDVLPRDVIGGGR